MSHSGLAYGLVLVLCSRYEHNGVWATEAEILTISHLPKTCIFTYLPPLQRASSDPSVIQPGEWTTTNPRNVDRSLPPPSHSDMGIYIRLMHSHFEVVKSVHQ